ncbi:MAG: adenylosuccinate lyase [Armatimonadetes bacterium]|nr:adenylosuccinate lyase [Armatimonadota bacterium]
MSDRTIFDNVSPLDFRYYGQDEKLQQALDPYVTERGRVMSEAMVEAAATRVLARRGLCSDAVADEVAAAVATLTPEEVAAEEQRIQHNIRALVNCIQAKVSDAARPYVHFTLTSFDVVDTATAWRLKQAALRVVIPDLVKLEQTLIALARREAETLQMGRTHGQHAVPVTFGFAIAEYVSRLGGRIQALQRAADDMRGKISGAVGAYNASSLCFADPIEFEAEILAALDLKPSLHSTQIVEAEFVTDYVHALVSAFGVLACLADDMRHLQRTEIAEVGEAFAAEQVGSSTMPHKRNPWNFENVKSMWKAFMPRMMTVYMDQLSEHQRDLTNSASARFVPEVIVGLCSSARRLNRIMGKLVTDEARMRANFAMTQGMIAAEPAYILLAAVGHPDAHEAMRKLTLLAQAEGRPLQELLFEAEELTPWLDKLTDEQRAILRDPAKYLGAAVEKTQRVCDHWEQELGPAGG